MAGDQKMLKLHCVLAEDDIVDIHAESKLLLTGFKTMIRLEADIEEQEQTIYFKDTTLTDEKKTLEEYGFKNGHKFYVNLQPTKEQIDDMINHGSEKPKPAPKKPDPPVTEPEKPKKEDKTADNSQAKTTPPKSDPVKVSDTPTKKPEPAPASGGGILMPLLVLVFILIAVVVGLIATKNFDKALEPVLPDATKTLGLQDLAKTLQDAVDGGAAADEGKSDL